MPQVRYTPRARDDLISLWVDVALDNPTAADAVYARLETRVRTLERFPEMGVARPDIASEARLLAEGSYLILYRLLSAEVQIVRVVHGARDVDGALFSEGID